MSFSTLLDILVNKICCTAARQPLLPLLNINLNLLIKLDFFRLQKSVKLKLDIFTYGNFKLSQTSASLYSLQNSLQLFLANNFMSKVDYFVICNKLVVLWEIEWDATQSVNCNIKS